MSNNTFSFPQNQYYKPRGNSEQTPNNNKNNAN